MAWFESTGLSLIVFLPVAGALALFAFPKVNEAAQKWTALLVTGLTGVLAVLVAVAFDYRASERFQFEVTESWIPAIGANYHIGVDGISLPLLSCRRSDLPRGGLLVGPLGRAAQRSGVPGADAAPGNRYERDVRGARPGAVLHLLRAGTATDVLHDRHLGRQHEAAHPGAGPDRDHAPLRGHQVLHLHPVRVGLHAAGLPGAPLPLR